MQFLNPLGLLVLGLIPILLLIHSLKPKAKRVPVTTFFLWKDALQEQPAGWHIHKLLKNLPLICQIIIIIFSALALLQPVWFWNTEQYGNMIVVLDTSASMKTRGGDQTRFEKAREKALQLIDELPELSKALVIESGRLPTVKINFSNDKQALFSTIYEIEPTDNAGNLKQAVFLALSFYNETRDDQIFVITDGAGAELENITGIHKNITPLLISGGSNNVGITKLEFRKELAGQDNYQILLEVQNFNQSSVQVPLRFTLNNSLLANPSLTLNPGEKKLLFFPYSGTLSGIAEARLDLEDDFSIDNQAHAVLNSAKQIEVLLVTKGNFYLERLLEAYPNFNLEVTDRIPQPWRTKIVKKDIVVLDRMAPPSTLSGNFLLIDAFSPNIPLLEEKTVFTPQMLDWDPHHPIMANMDLSGIRVEKATQIKAEGGLKPIVESEGAGLVYTYEKEDLRAVQFAFDLTRSDLPLKVAFPMLMSNIFRWLYPYKFEFASLQTQTGTPYPLELRKHFSEVTIQTPSGKKETYLPQSRPFYFPNTQEAGIYLVSQGRSNQFFAANLLDETESNIRVPAFEAANDEIALTLIADTALAEHPLWMALFLLAAVFLLLEWYFWAKPR